MAQAGNPFDLTPRLSEKQQAKIEKSERTTSEDSLQPEVNPFDLVRDEALEPKKSPKAVLPIQETRKTSSFEKVNKGAQSGSKFLFFLIFFNLILFSVLVVSFRGVLQKVFRAVMNDNMLSQFYAERYNNQIIQSVLMLYSLFFINMSLFLFLLSKKTDWIQLILYPDSDFKSYLVILLGVFLLLMLKHFVLRYIGFVFPLKMETGLYNFSIIIFAIFISILLLPLNIVIAFIGEYAIFPLVFIVLIGLAVLYGLRYLRGIFIANKLISLHKVHFLLYICTVEIAPPLILYRLFINN